MKVPAEVNGTDTTVPLQYEAEVSAPVEIVFAATLPNVNALKVEDTFEVIVPDVAFPVEANFPALVHDEPLQLATLKPKVSANPLAAAQYNFTFASAGVAPLLVSKTCSRLLTETIGAVTELVFEKDDAKYCPVQVVELDVEGITSKLLKLVPLPVGKMNAVVEEVVLTIGPFTKLLALELAWLPVELKTNLAAAVVFNFPLVNTTIAFVLISVTQFIPAVLFKVKLPQLVDVPPIFCAVAPLKIIPPVPPTPLFNTTFFFALMLKELNDKVEEALKESFTVIVPDNVFVPASVINNLL